MPGRVMGPAPISSTSQRGRFALGPCGVSLTRCRLDTLTGFIMVEQVKSIDFRSRLAKRIETGSDELLSEVLSVLDACIY
jgi:mRNA-degrading endonuclease toxin of MazEF toxin-antitoxin module